MKNLFRQYRLPALVTILIHIAVLLVANWPKQPNPVSTVITTDCGGCGGDPPVELVETWEIDDDCDYSHSPVFAWGEVIISPRKPLFYWTCCEFGEPPTPARPEMNVQRITRIDGVDLPELRMIVGFPTIDLSGNSYASIDYSEKNTGRKVSALRLVRQTTRMAMLGPRR